MFADEIRVHAWLSRRPAPLWVLLLKGPEISASGASLGRARRELASTAYEWAAAAIDAGPTDPGGEGAELELARRIVTMHEAGDLAEALMPRPEAVFRADDLPRAA